MANPLWRHKKRGTIYEILSDVALLQCSTWPEFEAMAEHQAFTVYRDTNTGAIYVRLTVEFLDGRFEKLPASGPKVPHRR